jgi:hypothetical protein
MAPTPQPKESLRAEIEDLRRQRRSSEYVLSAVVQPQLTEPVMTRLRNGHSVDAISKWLVDLLPSNADLVSNPGPPEPKTGADVLLGHSYSNGVGSVSHMLGSTVLHNTSAPHLRSGNASPHSHSTWSPDELHPVIEDDVYSTTQPSSRTNNRPATILTSPSERASQINVSTDSPKMRLPGSTWTDISHDSELIEHLLALYFCWDYPTFASISKEHFWEDFINGRSRYCCPILVNALLALGCRCSLQPDTCAVYGEPKTSGDHFFDESLRLLNLEKDHATLTIVQALGIMSIRQASRGKDSESKFYATESMRISLDMGLNKADHKHDKDEATVRAATFWGAFALDQYIPFDLAMCFFKATNIPP